MLEKKLAKISRAYFGVISDYPFLMGLDLSFSADSWGIGSGGRDMVNMNTEAKWSNDAEHKEAVFKMVLKVKSILEEAKVESVHALIGKPVEVTIENNVFKDFRILTEVL